jgi:hypothetical protein
MLFLKPPYQMINGIAVFSDHADELQYYYMPAAPHLSVEHDPVRNVDTPKIQLIKFRGGAGNGGFLTFEVNLGIAENALDDVKAELRHTRRLRDEPRLLPVPVESGTVSLVMLGMAFDDAGKPILDDQQQPRFAVRKSPSAHPSLYGDNTAIFSVELDQDGVQLVEESLKQTDFMPIGVIYSLDFYALRPAFTVNVSADWDRVQDHFSKSFKADVLFSSVEIDSVVDKLIENQVVKIDVDSFLPEGEDAGSWVGRRDQAVNEFKDMVLQNFFKPSLDPVKADPPDGWDKAGDFVDKLSVLGATGGAAAFAKFSYVEQSYKRIDDKHINLRMNERVTMKKSIYPQGMLRNLARMPVDAQGHVDLSRFMIEVTLDDDWFMRRKAKAHSLVDYDNDHVESVTVTLDYDGHPQTVRLTKDQAEGERQWNSIVRNGAMVRPVDYEYSVAFRGVNTAERPGIIVSPKRTTIGDEFDISPRGENLYFIDDIQIGAGVLPWDRYPQIGVEVRYHDAANRVHIEDSFLLTKDKPEVTWKRFRLDASLSAYDYRLTYMAVNRRDIQVDWTTTNQERLIVRDPQPLRRTLQVAPAVDWRLVAMAFCELRYLDEENGVDEQTTLSFFDTPQDRVPKTFSIDLVDGTRRLVSYATTFILKDNRTIIVPPSMTAGSIIVLRTDMAGHRVVTVTPPDVSFPERGIVRIEAALAYADPDNGLEFNDKLTFANAHDQGSFEFDYVTALRANYSCSTTLVLANGLAVQHDMGSLDADRLVLPAA